MILALAHSLISQGGYHKPKHGQGLINACSFLEPISHSSGLADLLTSGQIDQVYD
jgi:hypothetical protein